MCFTFKPTSQLKVSTRSTLTSLRLADRAGADLELVAERITVNFWAFCWRALPRVFPRPACLAGVVLAESFLGEQVVLRGRALKFEVVQAVIGFRGECI